MFSFDAALSGNKPVFEAGGIHFTVTGSNTWHLGQAGYCVDQALFCLCRMGTCLEDDWEGVRMEALLRIAPAEGGELGKERLRLDFTIRSAVPRWCVIELHDPDAGVLRAEHGAMLERLKSPLFVVHGSFELPVFRADLLVLVK